MDCKTGNWQTPKVVNRQPLLRTAAVEPRRRETSSSWSPAVTPLSSSSLYSLVFNKPQPRHSARPLRAFSISRFRASQQPEVNPIAYVTGTDGHAPAGLSRSRRRPRRHLDDGRRRRRDEHHRILHRPVRTGRRGVPGEQVPVLPYV